MALDFSMLPSVDEESPKAEKPFYMVYKNIKIFRRILKAVKVCTEEPVFEISPEGIYLRTLDPSHVAMVILNMPKKSFYEWNVPEPLKLCFDIEDFLKMTRLAKEGETLTLKRHEEVEARLQATVKGAYPKNYTIPTLEYSEKEVISEPKLNFNATVTLEVKALEDILRETENMSEQIQILATAENITFKAISDLGDVTIPIDRTNQITLEHQVHQESKALYSLSFLIDMVKALKPLSDTVKLEFSTEKPLKLEIGIPTDTTLTYYLAPRLE